MDYVSDAQASYLDSLVDKFREGTFGVWFKDLNDHNRRNLACLLNNQMNYVNRLTEMQMGKYKPFDVLDFVCQEFKKLAFCFPENIFAMPNAVSEFKYYNENGEPTILAVKSILTPKGDKEFTETLKAKLDRDALAFKPKDFYIFPLLLWVLPSTSPLESAYGAQDYWFGDTMFVKEGKPKEETKE